MIRNQELHDPRSGTAIRRIGRGSEMWEDYILNRKSSSYLAFLHFGRNTLIIKVQYPISIGDNITVTGLEQHFLIFIA